MKKSLLLAIVGCLSLSGAALAHHGDAGRYIEEVVTITGKVVELQLVNPHSIVVFDVAADGTLTPNGRRLDLKAPVMLLPVEA